MNPLEILVKSHLKITPTLLEYEVGTDIEVFLYHFLNTIKDNYNNIIIISFFDAHKALFGYLERVFGDHEVQNLLQQSTIIPVYGKEVERIEGATPIIAGVIRQKLGDYVKKCLVVMIGLDFYSIIFGEDNFAKLFPRIVSIGSYNQNLDVMVVLNTKLFSNRLVQIVDSYCFNIARLGIEEDEEEKELRRFILIVRSVFLEFNLSKWYYRIDGREIKFYQKNNR